MERDGEKRTRRRGIEIKTKLENVELEDRERKNLHNFSGWFTMSGNK